jgi:hypothetical protein
MDDGKASMEYGVWSMEKGALNFEYCEIEH